MAGERRYLGLGEETTFGTGVPATFFLDFLSSSLEAPSEPLIFYEGAGGRGQAISVPGPYIPSGDIEVGVDVVDALHLFKWALGRYGIEGTDDSPPSTTLAAAAEIGDTTISVNSETDFAVNDYIQIDSGIGADTVKIAALDGGAGPTYSWTISPGLLNVHSSDDAVKRVTTPFKHIFRPTQESTLPSFTARVGKGLFEHTFFGTAINSISFSVDRGILVVRASLLSQIDKNTALDSASKTFPSSLFLFRHGATAIDGVDRTSMVQSFSIQWSNNIDEAGSVRHGSRFPQKFPVQGVDVTGSLQLAFEDMAEYTRFWGGSGEPPEAGSGTFKFDQSFSIGADVLRFILGSALWTQVSTPVSGRDRILQEVSFKSIDDPSWDLITVEVTNNKERY